MHCCVLLVLYYDRSTSKEVLHDSDFESTRWYEIVDNNSKMH